MIYHIITDNVNFLCYNNYKLKLVKLIKLISKALPGPKVSRGRGSWSLLTSQLFMNYEQKHFLHVLLELNVASNPAEVFQTPELIKLAKY